VSTDTAMKSAATTEGVAAESAAEAAPEPAAIEPATIITIMAAEEPTAVVVRIGVAIAVWVVVRLIIWMIIRAICEWITVAMKARIYLSVRFWSTNKHYDTGYSENWEPKSFQSFVCHLNLPGGPFPLPLH
jgi:hypothetical protein